MSIDTALTNLDTRINERFRVETAYVEQIKTALVTIIRDMRDCVEAVVENRTTMSPEERTRLNDRIQESTRRLRAIDPMNPRNILDPFRQYAINNIRNNDPNKATAAIVGPAPRSIVNRLFGQPALSQPQNVSGHENLTETTRSINQDVQHRDSDDVTVDIDTSGLHSSLSAPDLRKTSTNRIQFFGGWKQKRSTRTHSKRFSKRR